MKYADVLPIFKKNDKTDKENYSPISILPNLSKLHKRLIYDHMYPFLYQIFSKLQCGCHRGFNVELCSKHMIEKWGKHLDTSHDRPRQVFWLYRSSIAYCKLNAYDADTSSLYLWVAYLETRKQITKMNGSYSNFDEILCDVQQGFILGPLLLNMHICDSFFGTGGLDIVSYVGDYTPYTCTSELDIALRKLKSYAIKN